MNEGRLADDLVDLVLRHDLAEIETGLHTGTKYLGCKRARVALDDEPRKVIAECLKILSPDFDGHEYD